MEFLGPIQPGEFDAEMMGEGRLCGLASGMIAGGAGAMTFGIVYGRERRSREKLFFRPEQVRLVPELSDEMAGMALVGRF